MSKKLILTLFAILALAVTTMQAQSPNAFNYQALVRDAAGQVLPETRVSFRIHLSDPASPAAPAYTEIHQVTTDAFGRVALQIGQGKPVNGLFSELDWAGAQYAIQVELDVRGGSDFVALGSSQLLSVPYALHARTVENDRVEDSDADPKNELQRLELAGDTLQISDGNYVVLSPGMGGNQARLSSDTTAIMDNDGDTRIDLDLNSSDDDRIHFDLDGTEHFRMDGGRLEVLNNNYQVLIGENAGAGANSEEALGNTIIGANAGMDSLIGGFNVAVGIDALSNSSGEDNVAIGAGAGQYSGSGSGNVFIGAYSGGNETGSDKLYIENTSSASPLIYGDFAEDEVRVNGSLGIGIEPEEALHVQGNIRMADGNQAAGHVMVSDSNGTAVWMDPDSLGIDTDTDEQTLSLTDDTLAISNGNGIYLKDYLVEEMNAAMEDGMMTLPTYNAPQLDAFQNANHNIDETMSSCQSFTPTVSGLLTSIELPLPTYYDTPHPSSVLLSVYLGDVPNGTQIFSDTIPLTQGIHFSRLELTSDVNVVAGTLYTFEVSSVTSDWIAIVWAHGSVNDDKYVGGSRSCSLGANPSDMQFATFIAEASTVPAIKTDSSAYLLSLYDSALNIDSEGNVGIATTSPEEKLHVEGNIRMVDGNQQSGYILSSDSNGTASWTDPSSLGIDADDQTLTLSGTTLSITDGNNVDLSSIASDDQTLSLSGATLSIADGNSVDLSAIADSDFSLSRVNAGSNTKVLTIEGKRDNGGSFGAFAEIQFKNTDGNSGGSGTPYVGAKIAAGNTDGSDDGDLRFYTYNGSLSQRMIINNDGEFGFGTDDPDYSFDVVQDKNNDYVARIRNTANSNSSTDNGLLIQAGHSSYDSGNQSAFIQFETPDGTFCGRIKQDGGSSVNYYDASDRRLKENITDTRYGLQDLLKIRVRDYNYIADGPDQPRTGFIAQELYEVYPTAVDKGGDDVKTEPWSVAYGKLTPVLVQAVQDQQELIEAQQEELAAQREKLEAQETELQALRKVALVLEDQQKALEMLKSQVKALESSASTSSGLTSR